MIPFLDVAFGAFLQNLFPALPIVFAPPEVSRQNLARKENNAGKAQIGAPGISFFRMEARKNRRSSSLPQAAQGFNAGRQPGATATSARTNFMMVQEIRAEVLYTVSAWAREISDLSMIERPLWFCDVYTCVNATIKAMDPNTGEYSFTAPYAFPFEGDDPRYKQITDSDTGKVTWYGLEKDFKFSAPWMRTAQAPYIEEVILKVYQGMSSGEPLRKDLLEIIHFDKDQTVIFPPY